MNEKIDRNKELGNFLKSRRKKIRPSQVGLPEGQRRRTPGLRREEVAFLAGVGVTWYTWIEQGRSIKISQAVLTGIARALQLDSHETTYIFDLAQLKFQTALPEVLKVDTMYQNFLDSLSFSPATMTDQYWNILAWNEAAEKVFIDFNKIDITHRNMIELMFTNQEYQSRFLDWEVRAKKMLSVFRKECIHIENSIWLQEFLKELEQKSKEFGTWWKLYDVAPEEEVVKTITHPKVGELIFEHTVFLTPENRYKIYINTPDQASKTKDKVKHLL